MAKYRKIDVRIWNDLNFNSLSDKAKLVFFFLLTHPNLTPLGAMRCSLVGMADELNWTEKAFREAFREASEKAMVKHSERHKLVWLPHFLRYNKPESPNVVVSWSKWLDELPECPLKHQVLCHSCEYCESLPKAFREALPKAFREAFAKGMPNQEQEQEQEQEKIKRSRRVNSENEIEKQLPKRTTELNNQVKEVFEHWQLIMNKPRSILNKKRKRKILDRLKEKYSVDDLKRAIEGIKKSSYHMRKGFDDIELICRDAIKTDKYIGFYYHPPVESEKGQGKTIDQAMEDAEETANRIKKAFSFDDTHTIEHTNKNKKGEDYDNERDTE